MKKLKNKIKLSPCFIKLKPVVDTLMGYFLSCVVSCSVGRKLHKFILWKRELNAASRPFNLSLTILRVTMCFLVVLSIISTYFGWDTLLVTSLVLKTVVGPVVCVETYREEKRIISAGVVSNEFIGEMVFMNVITALVKSPFTKAVVYATGPYIAYKTVDYVFDVIREKKVIDSVNLHYHILDVEGKSKEELKGVYKKIEESVIAAKADDKVKQPKLHSGETRMKPSLRGPLKGGITVPAIPPITIEPGEKNIK